MDSETIYREQAEMYEALISREDDQQQLLPALARIRAPAGLDVIDLGTGTGRLAVMLAPWVRSLLAFDLAHPMLAVATRRLRESDLRNWSTAVADHRALPVGAAVADLAISGWSIVYTVVWYERSWPRELRQALREMRRVLRPGGTLVIIETLGTGETTPHPPENLLEYFAALERARFASTWIRTDYRFATREEARSLVPFFFGEAMLERLVVTDEGVILPECTGIWWRSL